MKRFAVAGALVALGVATVASGQGQPQLVGIAGAVKAAEAHTGAGAFEAELEGKGSARYYEISLAKGQSVYRARVDASTGRVITANRPRLTNLLPKWAADDIPSAPKRIAPMLEMIERETNGTIHELGFDVEKGQEIYEIEVATANGVAELYLDAKTGKRMPISYED